MESLKLRFMMWVIAVLMTLVRHICPTEDGVPRLVQMGSLLANDILDKHEEITNDYLGSNTVQ